MSEFIKPPHVSGPEERNVNALKFLIGSTEATIEALERQLSSAPEASIPSIEAQIRANKEKLSKLREELDALEAENSGDKN